MLRLTLPWLGRYQLGNADGCAASATNTPGALPPRGPVCNGICPPWSFHLHLCRASAKEAFASVNDSFLHICNVVATGASDEQLHCITQLAGSAHARVQELGVLTILVPMTFYCR